MSLNGTFCCVNLTAKLYYGAWYLQQIAFHFFCLRKSNYLHSFYFYNLQNKALTSETKSSSNRVVFHLTPQPRENDSSRRLC
jgi:hypothetical protein